MPLWQLDDRTVKEILRSELSSRYIKEIHVKTKYHSYLAIYHEDTPDTVTMDVDAIPIDTRIIKMRLSIKNDPDFATIQIYLDETPINLLFKTALIHQIIYILLLDIVIVFLLSLLMNSFIFKRLQKLAKVASKIEAGKFENKISSKSHDEIGYLANCLNKMQKSLFFSRKLDQDKSKQLKLAHVKLNENYEVLTKAHTDLKMTQSQLIQSSKLASIGQLAAGIAHEINTPLAYVLSNVQILEEYISKFNSTILSIEESLGDSKVKSEKLKENIKDILKVNKLDFLIKDSKELIMDSIDGMKRVAEIIRDLKTFSHVDESNYQEVNINDCIEQTLKVAWNELKYKCIIEKNYGQLPNILCYPSQVNQIIMNLLVNASQALIDVDNEKNINKITIFIKTRYQVNKDNSKEIIVEIKDNGCGMSEAQLSNIFDPFYTTKPVGVGTGLGLSISYGIMQKHKGKIQVLSKEGVGTTFTLIFPIMHQS